MQWASDHPVQKVQLPVCSASCTLPASALQPCAAACQYACLHLLFVSRRRQQLQAALQVVDSGLGAPAGLLGSPTTPGAATSAPGSTSSWSSCLRPALALDCLLLRIKAQVGGGTDCPGGVSNGYSDNQQL